MSLIDNDISSRIFWITQLVMGIFIGLQPGFESKIDSQELSRFFEIERSVAHQGFDGRTCWVHARAGVIPPEARLENGRTAQVVMTSQKLLLSGSDVFYSLHQTTSVDSGRSWSPMEPLDRFARKRLGDQFSAGNQGAGIASDLVQTGDELLVCDFTPQWHSASQRLLGVGQTVWYRGNGVLPIRPRSIAYACYDSKQTRWSDWQSLELPKEERFKNAGAGSAQRVDLVGGDILIPFYFKEPQEKQYSVAVCRCRFDGKKLYYLKHGNELSLGVDRGLFEPSLTRFQNRFYLTLRNDRHGYVSTSEDGLHFNEPVRWRFDDGKDLGNYNTQQHWVTHSEKLFLVYTRRGAKNDHVFRHRAPLFIAEVDPVRLKVVRETERVLIEEKGARLGNFGITKISDEQTWVTATEWMQPLGVEKYGSDNRLHVARIKWRQPDLGGRAKTVPFKRKRAESKKAIWNKIGPYFSPPPRLIEKTEGYPSVLNSQEKAKVSSKNQWLTRRKEIQSRWQEWLGQWPPSNKKQQLQVLESTVRENFVQQKVRFQWSPKEATTGYLLIPDGSGPHPAVVTVFYEPETAIGLGKPNLDFALQLTRRGFVTLSLGTTQATANQTYAIYHPTIDQVTVQPLSMLAHAASNAWYVLANHPQVDRNRIGIVGHSFGGKWSMFAACQFDKFACAAWSDPGIVFEDNRPSINYWEPWYLGHHQRPWRKRGLPTAENPAVGLYPRLRTGGHDLHELHVLMAPRPFLVSGGSEDPIERWHALRATMEVNQLLGVQNRVAMTNRPDHSPNPDSNEIIYLFFEYFLSL